MALRPVRTVVCDDELDAREGLVTLLARDPEIAVVATARNGQEAVAAISGRAPDLVFLDVQMPKPDGFGVIEEVGADQFPVVIFVTAYDEYALRAFEVHALDYLLKPFSNARFAEALAHAKAIVRQRRASGLSHELAALLGDAGRGGTDDATQGAHAAPDPPAKQYLEHVLVRLGGTVILVRVDDIDWIEADDYYAKLHVATRTYLVRETMQRLEAKLDPRQFIRVHRSAIVHLERVHALEPAARGSHALLLASGARVPLSRAKRATFEAAVSGRG